MSRWPSRSRAPLLLTGPTGAGKSQLARRIYELKKARRQVDRPVRGRQLRHAARGRAPCRALFGHVKGAFTGAVGDRPGLLRQADGGVLFLDEIGELGADEQAMLLRAIEDKRFLPVGSDKEVESDFQLIAGTNRDLRRDVERGRFREDLLARINLWTFRAARRCASGPRTSRPTCSTSWTRPRRSLDTRVTMNKEAQEHFLRFATRPERPLERATSATSTRRCCAWPRWPRAGASPASAVDEEIDAPARDVDAGAGPRRGGARATWLAEVLGAERAAELDRFDRVQLADVLAVCRQARSCPTRGAAALRAVAARRRASTTRTGCGSTSPASG